MLRAQMLLLRAHSIVMIVGVFFANAMPSVFALPAPVPGENQLIDISGSTVRIKGVTEQTNRAFVNGREIKIEKDGSFNEEVVVPLGETSVTVEIKDKD